jgi:hypothetical protein
MYKRVKEKKEKEVSTDLKLPNFSPNHRPKAAPSKLKRMSSKPTGSQIHPDHPKQCILFKTKQVITSF